MASSTFRTICSLCSSTNMVLLCTACKTHFCYDHIAQHRTDIENGFVKLQNDHDQFRQQINDFKTGYSTKHSLIERIDQWEKKSIDKVKRQAQLCRNAWIQYSTIFFPEIEDKLNHFAGQVKDIQLEKNFNEIDLNYLKQKLGKLKEELNQPTNVSIREQPNSFIHKIFLFLPSGIPFKQLPIIIAGGNGRGELLNQFNFPAGISVDDHNQMIYIADRDNHRIIEFDLNTKITRIVAGGNGQGNRLDQLSKPRDVIIDRQNNDLIIADCGNRRVMRWSRHSNSPTQIIINDMDCSRLAIHEDGTLYVSDCEKCEVRRWKKGKRHGTIVAGGNGRGNQLNQLDCPSSLFIDDNHNLYISDWENHRVMKWLRGASEGVVVVGGNGKGAQSTQLSCPLGVIVDHNQQIYVADSGNHRVMRWREGEKNGTIVVGGNGQEGQKNQFFSPNGLSLDDEGNLYVADWENHRILKFQTDLDYKKI